MGDLYERDLHPPKGLPGEYGQGHRVSKEEKEEEKKLYSINQFNLLVCNKISINRSLADYRPKGFVSVFSTQNSASSNWSIEKNWA